MSIFNWFKSKNEPISAKEQAYRFDDADREESLYFRRKRAELRRQKELLDMERISLQLQREREELEDMRAEMREDNEEPENDGNIDNMLAGFLGNILNGNRSTAPLVIPTGNTPVSNEVNFSDQQIDAILQQFTKQQLTLFSNFSIDTQKKMIRDRIPNISEETLNRAIAKVKG